MHRELGRFFRTLTANRHTKWAPYVPIISSIINETHRETTEKTPWELHFRSSPERMWKNWMQFSERELASLEARVCLARDTMHRKSKDVQTKRTKTSSTSSSQLAMPSWYAQITCHRTNISLSFSMFMKDPIPSKKDWVPIYIY